MEAHDALALETPNLAPKSADNDSVVLWALAMAVFVAAIAARTLWQMVTKMQGKLEAAEAKCASENAALRERMETILTESVGKLSTLCERNNEIIDNNTRVIQRYAETDRYERKH